MKHTLVAGANTEYRETIAVVAHQGGTIAIPPAYLDAIDARDGKPNGFSNDLTLRIAGPASLIVGTEGPNMTMLSVLGFRPVVIVVMRWLRSTCALRRRSIFPTNRRLQTHRSPRSPIDAPADAAARARSHSPSNRPATVRWRLARRSGSPSERTMARRSQTSSTAPRRTIRH